MRLYRVFAWFVFRVLALPGGWLRRKNASLQVGFAWFVFRVLALPGGLGRRKNASLQRVPRGLPCASRHAKGGCRPRFADGIPPVCVSPSGDYSSPLGLSSGGVTGSSLPSSPPPGWPGLSSSLSESPLAPPWPAEVSGAFDFWPMTSRL